MSELIVGCTGHRPDKLGGYSRTAFGRLLTVATDYLCSVRPDKCISGVALGWDMAFGWAAVNLGIPLIAAVPFKGQDNRWPSESRLEWRKLLDRCEVVVVVSPGGYSARKMQIRNEWVVDHSGRIAALWDGSVGGTANCVAYAELNRKPIDNLYREWLEIAGR